MDCNRTLKDICEIFRCHKTLYVWKFCLTRLKCHDFHVHLTIQIVYVGFNLKIILYSISSHSKMEYLSHSYTHIRFSFTMIHKLITIVSILSLDVANYASATCDEEMMSYREENEVIGGFNEESVLPELTDPTDIFNYCTADETFSLTCTADFPELLGPFEEACDEVGGIFVTYDLESSDGCSFEGFNMVVKALGVPQCLGPSCDADDHGEAFAEAVSQGILNFGVTGCEAEVTDVSVGGPKDDDSGVISTRGIYLSALLCVISAAFLN